MPRAGSRGSTLGMSEKKRFTPSAHTLPGGAGITRGGLLRPPHRGTAATVFKPPKPRRGATTKLNTAEKMSSALDDPHGQSSVVEEERSVSTLLPTLLPPEPEADEPLKDAGEAGEEEEAAEVVPPELGAEEPLDDAGEDDAGEEDEAAAEAPPVPIEEEAALEEASEEVPPEDELGSLHSVGLNQGRGTDPSLARGRMTGSARPLPAAEDCAEETDSAGTGSQRGQERRDRGRSSSTVVPSVEARTAVAMVSMKKREKESKPSGRVSLVLMRSVPIPHWDTRSCACVTLGPESREMNVGWSSVHRACAKATSACEQPQSRRK